MKKRDILLIVVLINLIVFSLVNIIFDIKYEQVDDFMIYSLYSGLDGTYNPHGIYIHPAICMLIGLFFRIIPCVNWHSIFLLLMQFICFTIIGYIIIEKQKSKIAILIYSLFSSLFYTTLLLLIQFTSVAGLLILTSFIIILNEIEKTNSSKKWTITSIILYSLGVLTRIQSLLIIIPFFGLYFIYYLIKYKLKDKTIKIIKYYLILFFIAVIAYVSNLVIYNSDNLYKEYTEYNNLRTQLHDLSYTDYNENKEIFDEIGWSQNDHYIFYTFNFGDENVYSKENLQKIVEYKKQKGEYYNLNLQINSIVYNLCDQMLNVNTLITLMFIVVLLINILDKENRNLNIFIALTTVAVNTLFVILNRSMLRVVLPEYILGTALLLYNSKYKFDKEQDIKIIAIISIVIPIVTVYIFGMKYNFNYTYGSYSNYKKVIEYANSHKENAYLYTVPSLQHRYLAYSVYEMPPKAAFSNLRVMGNWDMFTKNYYDFKQRYDLEGTFLDLLKENVYLIDGENIIWSGSVYNNYIDRIVLFIKENYNINVKYERVEEFDNMYIYKLSEQ